MAVVRFTRHLCRYFPDLREQVEVEAGTVAEIVEALERLHPGLGDYIRDESGALRKHVNVFIGEKLVRDRRGLTDAVGADAQVSILQALSGG